MPEIPKTRAQGSLDTGSVAHNLLWILSNYIHIRTHNKLWATEGEFLSDSNEDAFHAYALS